MKNVTRALVLLFAVFAAAAAITVLLLALSEVLSLWIALRAVAGYCMAGLYMTMESWLNHRAANEIRGRTFAVYAVVSGAAVAAGPLLLNVASPLGFELFSLTAILYIAALLPVSLTRTGNPEIARRTRLSLKRLLGGIGFITVGTAIGVVALKLTKFSADKVFVLNLALLCTAAALIGAGIFHWFGRTGLGAVVGLLVICLTVLGLGFVK